MTNNALQPEGAGCGCFSATPRDHKLFRSFSRPNVGYTLLLLSAACAIVLMGAYSYRAIDDELTASVLSRRASVTYLAAAVLSEKFDRLVDIGVSLASRVRFRELVAAGEWERASQILDNVFADFPFLDRIALVHPDGTLMADVPPSPTIRGRNFAHRDWYGALVRAGQPYISQVYERSAPPAAKVFVAAVPIKNAAGAMTGMLVLQVRSDRFFEWTRQIETGAGGLVYVVDNRGTVAAHPDLPPGSMLDYSKVSVVQQLVQGRRGVEITRSDGVEHVTAYEPIARHGWGVVIDQPASVVFATRDDQLRRVLLGYALVFLFLVSVAYLVSRITVQRRRSQEERRVRAELQRYVGRLEALLDMDKAILEAQSPNAIASVGLQHLRRLMPYSGATVRVFDPTSNVASALVVEHGAGSHYGHQDHLSLDAYGASDLAKLERGQVCVVPDAAALVDPAPVIELLRRQGMRSYVRVPLMVEGRLVGALNVWSNEPAHFTQAQIEIARAISDQLAITLQHAILRERVEKQAAELERRVAERTAQLVEKNQELESFSYSVSHDLRSPLRAISGYTRILQEDYGASLDAEGKRYLAVVNNEAGRMGALIDDLLAFSRLGREDFRPAAIDMAALVRDVVKEVRPTAGATEIEIAPLPQAVGDRALLRQVWLNLISNAAKYSGKQVKPRIRVSGEEKAAETVYRVEDNGAGFDMRHYDKLFGVFQRLHGFAEFPGTGIGLAIVKQVVTRHGGRVWAEGEIGRGATFYFSLPRGG